MKNRKDTCEHCPAFAKQIDDGKELLVPLRGADGNPLTKDGAVQYERGDDGRFVFHGACRLRAPTLLANGSTAFPMTKSNWWCLDPLRRNLLKSR